MKGYGGSAIVGCLLLVAVTVGACTTQVSSAAVEPVATQPPVQIELEALVEMPAELPDGNTVEVVFTLTNSSETDLYVLKWYTPLEGLAGRIFRVMRDGEPVPYEGPLAMRGDPSPDAYVFLKAGSSAMATVDLAEAYDFSEPGRYTINFISPWISHVARGFDQMALSVDDLGPVQMESNEVVVEVLKAAEG